MLLGDICTITSSKRIFASDYTDIGVPFYRSKEIIELNHGESISTPLYISQEKFDAIKKKFGVPSPNDILITSVGTIGVPYQVKESDLFYFKDGNLTWLKNFSPDIDPLFIYYYISNPFFNSFLQNISIGSSQSALTIEKLKRIEISVPSLPIQSKIGKILSEYDSLIAINNRRISILEEIAIRTYLEWFVHFRFPGHNLSRLSDGLPEGWHIGNLSEIGKFKRGKNLTIGEAITGEYPVVAGGLNPSCYHNDFNAVAPVVTVSASGANAGYTRLYQTNLWAADCSYVDKKCPNTYFLYCFLKTNKDLTENLQIGSAQPHVHAKDLNRIKCIVPTNDVINDFIHLVKPIFEAIRNFELQNFKLQQMRDRLLPQLMSGKIKIKSQQ